MNILMVYQSVVDMCASLFMLLHTVVGVSGAAMSSESAYDRFVCLIWYTKQPLWILLTESTYGTFLTTVDRYVAVLYPFWYKNNVRTVSTINILCIHCEVCGMCFFQFLFGFGSLGHDAKELLCICW